MLADCHMHTCFSGDSDTPVRDMLDRALALGLPAVCITDHFDPFYPVREFFLDTPSYYRTLEEVREEYRGRLEVRIGVEIGLTPGGTDYVSEYIRSYPWDYVIGSVHQIGEKDPYYRDTFDTSDQEMNRLYFETTLENVQKAEGIHSLGHLDYVVRYGYRKGEDYDWRDYQEIIDEILNVLVKRDIALEVNTGGLKYGLGFPNPHPGILKRFRELGGEMITVGSDAHRPEHLAYDFALLPEILENSGFSSVVEFIQGVPGKTSVFG